MVQFTLIEAARGLPQSLLFFPCAARAHLEERVPRHETPKCHQPLSHCAQTVNIPAWYQFIYWPIHVTRGLTSTHLRGSMGSVWLRTISLNSRNIPEKQTLQHLPYGERCGTTANHNQRWEMRPVWRQCLLRERDRQPYGHRHYTRHTTFSYKSLGDWPISLPPVLLVAHEHNAAASPSVWALLSETTGRTGRFITPQTAVGITAVWE